jgi:hypothetical protein
MFLTFYRKTQEHQYSFEELYRANVMNEFELKLDTGLSYPRTHTVEVDTANLSEARKNTIANEIELVWGRMPRPQSEWTYHQFMIPKASGGFRTINAPNEALKEYQRLVADLLINKIKILAHDAAFAYIEKRCPKHAIQRHQQSRWFLKLDIKDFFPSLTFDLVFKHLMQLFPLSMYTEDSITYSVFKSMLEPCFLDGALPQGSPTSPVLSNLVMVPYDLAISKALRDFEGHNFTYTRYADDLLISAPHDFDRRKVIAEVQRILGTQLILKESKTRYGSSAGRNWNLGLMLNKDQQITVGHARKERAKAMLWNLMSHPIQVNKEEAYVLGGEFAYIESIEPEYMTTLDKKYQIKLQTPVSYKDILRDIIKRN